MQMTANLCRRTYPAAMRVLSWLKTANNRTHTPASLLCPYVCYYASPYAPSINIFHPVCECARTRFSAPQSVYLCLCSATLRRCLTAHLRYAITISCFMVRDRARRRRCASVCACAPRSVCCMCTAADRSCHRGRHCLSCGGGCATGPAQFIASREIAIALAACAVHACI